ncbi:hypothetical protein TURU_034077 [Turdus rufiventris]|nr:hypothetical protein TURU_034077 [Turdus rufiventris]
MYMIYRHRVVGSGIKAQSENPEVKVKGKDPVISQIIDKLKHVIQISLKYGYNRIMYKENHYYLLLLEEGVEGQLYLEIKILDLQLYVPIDITLVRMAAFLPYPEAIVLKFIPLKGNAPPAEPGNSILIPSLQILTDIDEIPSQMSLLKAKQAQLPQPFLEKEMFQSTALRNYLLCQSPDLFQDSMFLLLRNPDWTQYFICGLTRAE